ncbi:voltage-gated chloride channel family protein [Chitinophaga pollutisoli]|uniref:Voltage-gated chloride channel family protein n=1 Tax=Chitinophaga pollutisoli TaxID=3133966 RepID=A0ABZ2YP05_9BACT
MHKQPSSDPIDVFRSRFPYAYYLIIAVAVSFFIGSAVALFLILLDLTTVTRQAHPWLLYGLPVAGVFIWWVYHRFGKNSAAGNNLIIDEIHAPGGGVPLRMTPLVLFTTLITHLFGGSAGREGTAVQMGGSIAYRIGGWMKLDAGDMRIILMMGIAGGFGAVFGTPVAGTVFALEVLAIGKLGDLKALVPCAVAAYLSDRVCQFWGAGHTHYAIGFAGGFDGKLLGWVLLAGVAFGCASRLFSWSMHRVKDLSGKLFVATPWLMPFVGGCIIIGLVFIAGTQDYLGLGVTASHADGVSIVSAFREGGAEPFSWLWKLAFTVVTLGMGFKGGEVTPLFFIGATLGNAIALYAGVPVDLMAGLGFIAVFAGATNTPVACTLMGVELFGPENVVYFGAACLMAYYFSGHAGIYSSQRVIIPKFGWVKKDPRHP